MISREAGDDRPLILGIGGTTRNGSSSEKALAVAMNAAADAGARVLTLAGAALELPMYAPERGWRAPEAQRLVDAFRRCDGLIVASPSYHGSISGLLKNALDYAEDLRDDSRCYLDECPVGLIACGGGWQGASQALATLRSIAHALRAWPTPMGAVLNTSNPVFDAEGACIDAAARKQLETVGRQVVEFVQARRASCSLGSALAA
jgi:FMN reductase